MNETMIGQERGQALVAPAKSALSPRRQAILVLGMHRSGTSAVAGVIGKLGAALPKETLMGPDPCNLLGLFESAALAAAHNELLRSAGSHWHDWRQFNRHWIQSSAAQEHRQRIKDILFQEFGDEPLIVIKDPRICRFLPFIASILAELDLNLVVILPVRNPLEVAYSLNRRNKFPLSKSMLLWLRHVLDAEFHSRHIPRCLLRYEELLADWRHAVDRAAQMTGVIWPNRSDWSDVEIDRFLTPELHHERVSLDEFENHAGVMPMVRETHSILTKIVDGGESGPLLDRLDLIRTKFDEGCHIFAAAVAAEELAAADNSLIVERNTLAEAHDSLIAEYDTLAEAHDSLIEGHDALAKARDTLIAERDTLAVAHNNLIQERETLALVHKTLAAEHDALAREHRQLAAERDSLAESYRGVAAARDAMLASPSWRLTAPLRLIQRTARAIRERDHRQGNR